MDDTRELKRPASQGASPMGKDGIELLLFLKCTLCMAIASKIIDLEYNTMASSES